MLRAGCCLGALPHGSAVGIVGSLVASAFGVLRTLQISARVVAIRQGARSLAPLPVALRTSAVTHRFAAHAIHTKPRRALFFDEAPLAQLESLCWGFSPLASASLRGASLAGPAAS